jgi:hypothetical protein
MLAPAAELVDEGGGPRGERGGAPVDDAVALVSEVLARRELYAAPLLDAHEPRAGGVRQRKEPARHEAVLLQPVDLQRAVACRAAAGVAFQWIARVDERAAVGDQIDAACAQLDRALVVVRVPARAALSVRSCGEAEPGVAVAQRRDPRVVQRDPAGPLRRGKPLEAPHALGPEEPRHFRRTLTRLELAVSQRGRAQAREEAAVERAARHERQAPAGVEIADLRHLAGRLHQHGETSEEPGDRAHHRRRRGIVAGLRGEHGDEEELGAEALVSGGGFEVRPVRAHLARDLVPEHARPRARAAQLGKERAHDDQPHEVRRVVVGADDAGLLEV